MMTDQEIDNHNDPNIQKLVDLINSRPHMKVVSHRWFRKATTTYLFVIDYKGIIDHLAMPLAETTIQGVFNTICNHFTVRINTHTIEAG